MIKLNFESNTTAAVMWLKYCRYCVSHYPINQLINRRTPEGITLSERSKKSSFDTGINRKRIHKWVN